MLDEGTPWPVQLAYSTDWKGGYSMFTTEYRPQGRIGNAHRRVAHQSSVSWEGNDNDPGPLLDPLCWLTDSWER